MEDKIDAAELAMELGRQRAVAIVEAVMSVYAPNDTTPFASGFHQACEETKYRLLGEVWALNGEVMPPLNLKHTELPSFRMHRDGQIPYQEGYSEGWNACLAWVAARNMVDSAWESLAPTGCRELINLERERRNDAKVSI